MEKNQRFFALEAGSGLFEASDSSIGRITQDLSGKTWKNWKKSESRTGRFRGHSSVKK